MPKKVVYIELEEDEFRALKLVKDFVNTSWKNLLVYGAMKTVDLLGGTDKFVELVKEINEKTNAQNVDQKWEAIAKNLGINVEKIKECQTNEAYNLLDQEIALTSKTYPVQDPEAFGTDETSISGSPTLVINGIIYTGNRSAEDFKKAICSAFKNPPSECKIDLSANSSQNAKGVCK